MSDRVWAVVVAAGRGVRFGGTKQLAALAGTTVLERSVGVAAAACDGVVCVISPELDGAVPLAAQVRVVHGGATRSASVRAGLAAVPPDVGIVLVHDAARPLADVDLFSRVAAAVRSGADAAVPVVAVVDTIRHVDGGVVDRDQLRAVQTPQGFRRHALERAHQAGADATDDASLVEAAGGKVVLVPGDVRNLKITSPEDLLIAEALCR